MLRDCPEWNKKINKRYGRYMSRTKGPSESSGDSNSSEDSEPDETTPKTKPPNTHAYVNINPKDRQTKRVRNEDTENVVVGKKKRVEPEQ
jgi:hypothetical protein